MLGAALVDLDVAVLLLGWEWSKIRSRFDLKYHCRTCVCWWMNSYSYHCVLHLKCVTQFTILLSKKSIFILILNAGKVWTIVNYRWKTQVCTADVWLLMKCQFRNGAFVQWWTDKRSKGRIQGQRLKYKCKKVYGHDCTNYYWNS